MPSDVLEGIAIFGKREKAEGRGKDGLRACNLPTTLYQLYQPVNSVNLYFWSTGQPAFCLATY